MIGKRKTREVAGDQEKGNVIPLFGKDEMNLIEFPFGPVTANGTKTLEVEHEVFDKSLRREVVRKLIITGADAFGLPRPIDDQVLIGMKALTYEAGFGSQEVRFSRYELCRAIGWEPDGRAYKRLEESFDRIAGTTLKFKDAWWDNGEEEWKSETFCLIQRVSLCSRDQLDRKRLKTGQAQHRLCSFVWSDVVWKSFQDGFIRTLDMEMFRRVASGKRRDVPLRLFRILDKRFYFGNTARLKLERLCVGTLGLSSDYSPSQMYRILKRATEWLTECGFISAMGVEGGRLTRNCEVVFVKASRAKPSTGQRQRLIRNDGPSTEVNIDHKAWLTDYDDNILSEKEAQALNLGFGSDLERRLIVNERSEGRSIRESGRIRTDYLRRYLATQSSDKGRP